MTVTDYLAAGSASGLTVINLLLADATVMDIITPLVNIGVAGVMLWWFMSQVMPELKRIREQQHKANLEHQVAMNRVAHSNLMLVIATGLKPLEGQANTMLNEIKEANDELKREEDKIQ